MEKTYHKIKEIAVKFKDVPILGNILKATDRKFRELTCKKSIIFDGFKMFLNKDDPLGLSLSGGFEKDERKIFSELIKEGDTVLDVGANIGFQSLLFSRLVGEKGMVYAFEPFPENFALLKKNTEINNIRNIKPIQKAVSDVSGKEKFFIDKYSNASHGFYSFNPGGFMEVETIKLNDYEMSVDFVKIDVEGADGKVLKGMTKLIERSPNMKIMIEFCPRAIEKSGIATEEFLDLLENYFRIYRISEGNLIKANKRDLREKYTAENDKLANLFCFRK
jgi:FkbM family methyltransferase